jgi:hypothetical protein
MSAYENKRIRNWSGGSSFLSLVVSGIAGLLFRSSVIEITGKSKQVTHTSAIQAVTRLRSLLSEPRQSAKTQNTPTDKASQPRFSPSSIETPIQHKPQCIRVHGQVKKCRSKKRSAISADFQQGILEWIVQIDFSTTSTAFSSNG